MHQGKPGSNQCRAIFAGGSEDIAGSSSRSGARRGNWPKKNFDPAPHVCDGYGEVKGVL
jgi:hypothetical protein